MEDVLNVLYSSDNAYAQHLGVSLCSLLENNKAFDRINCFVINNNISEENISRLDHVVEEYKNAVISYIPFDEYKEKLNVKMIWEISLSSYARLFVASCLPLQVKRVLYLDCDTIVCKTLKELWNTDLGDSGLGAVQDAVNGNVKSAIGLLEDEKYFNAGVLLIDLEKWRYQDTEEKCLQFIRGHGNTVLHHDQGVLNGLFKVKKILPVKNNLMTIHYVFNRNKVMRYTGEKAEYYSDEELQSAKEDPVILHFTPSFTSHPWEENCVHPLKHLYFHYLVKTPWKNSRLLKDKRKLHVRIYEWRYRVIPF